ncbi:hypothetical protein ACFL6I_14410 [candidate division KSB1 bacterium]
MIAFSKRKICWHILHEHWKSQLSDRVSKEQVTIYGHFDGIGFRSEADCSDVLRLINDGVVGVGEYFFSRGKLIVDINLMSLLAMSEFEIIGKWLEQNRTLYKNLFKRKMGWSILDNYFVNQNSFTSYLDLEIWIDMLREFDIQPVLLMINAFNEEEKAKEVLQKSESVFDVEQTYFWERIKVWALLFNEINRARQLYSDYNNYTVDNVVNLVECFGEIHEATRCLENITSQTNSCEEFITGARLWYELFCDVEKTRECLEKAEHFSNDIPSFLELATVNMELFENREKAKFLLNKALDWAKTARVRKKCEEKWIELLGEV